jgi:hypothetical protein
MVNGTYVGLLSAGGPAPAEFEITPLLAERNEIVIEVAAQEARGAAPGQLTGRLEEVRLEIRRR